MNKKYFHFNYQDYAKFSGLKPETLKLYVHQGKFNPYDFKSTFEFLLKYYNKNISEKQENPNLTDNDNST